MIHEGGHTVGAGVVTENRRLIHNLLVGPGPRLGVLFCINLYIDYWYFW